jgi:hypothetical protein
VAISSTATICVIVDCYGNLTCNHARGSGRDFSGARR